MDDHLPHLLCPPRAPSVCIRPGFYWLVFLTAALLILFGGVTDRAHPLYAIRSLSGVHTLAGRDGDALEAQRRIRLALENAGKRSGSYRYRLTLLVVLVAKFVAGAWVTALLIPLLILLMSMVKRHYARVNSQTEDDTPLDMTGIRSPFVIVPPRPLEPDNGKGECVFALALSTDVRAVAHRFAENRMRRSPLFGSAMWSRRSKQPDCRCPSLSPCSPHTASSFCRWLDYVLKMEKENQGRTIAVLVPELVVRHWWETVLHNQRAQLLKLLLLVKGNQGIVVLNIPWYLQK